jgi:hypothetical protein
VDYRARELGIYTGIGDGWLRVGALKMAMDGGTTPHTAYMYEPYGGIGLPQFHTSRGISFEMAQTSNL